MSRSSAAQATLAIATALEFLLVSALVTVFACMYPDRFRTTPWKSVGSIEWPSDGELAAAPIIWDQSLTLYNLCISVLSLVLWGIRFGIRGRSLDLYGAVTTNAFYDALLALLWTCSAVMQGSNDGLDPGHTSSQLGYNEHGCGESWSMDRVSCGAALASFALTIVAGVWFGSRLLVTCMYGAYVYGQERGEKDGIDRLMNGGMTKWAGLQYTVSDEALGV